MEPSALSFHLGSIFLARGTEYVTAGEYFGRHVFSGGFS